MPLDSQDLRSLDRSRRRLAAKAKELVRDLFERQCELPDLIHRRKPTRGHDKLNGKCQVCSINRTQQAPTSRGNFYLWSHRQTGTKAIPLAADAT